MFYEIRRYQIQPGRRDEWISYMEDVIIPFQTSKGMVINGSFHDEEDEDGYVWIRRFDDETQRKEQYAAVYESDEWVNNISPKVYELMILDQVTVTRAVPTSKSEMR
jgi:hypothetical protein